MFTIHFPFSSEWYVYVPEQSHIYHKNPKISKTSERIAATTRLYHTVMLLNDADGIANSVESKTISNDQELIQSDPISCPQNQTGNN